MEEVGKSAQDKFNAYFIEELRTLSKRFITRNSAMVAISSFREDKANIMEALRNHLDDKSSAEEKAFGVDVAISTEVLDFLSKVLSPPAECLKFYERCYGIAEDSGDQRRLADSLTALGFCHLCDAAHLRHNSESLGKFERAKEISEKLSKEQQNCQAHALIQCKLGLCLCLQVITCSLSIFLALLLTRCEFFGCLFCSFLLQFFSGSLFYFARVKQRKRALISFRKESS